MGQTNSKKITAQDRAILDLKRQRDKLMQYRRRITSVLELEQDIARRALASDNRQRALLALRRKKYQETLLAKTGAQLDVVEQLVSSIEFALVEKDVLDGLKQGNKVLAEIQKEMSLEKVEKLLEETEEAQRWQKELGDMLMDVVTHEEEVEVEEELEALQREMMGDKEGAVPKVGILPDAPKMDVLPDAPKAEPVMSQEEMERRELARQRVLEKRRREAEERGQEEGGEERQAIPA